ALQVEDERPSAGGRAGRAGGRRGHILDRRPRSRGAADGEGAEASGRRGGRVAQEAAHAVENVAALEEAGEGLGLLRVQPFAARLDRVPAGDDGEVVLELEPLDGFVDARAQ